MGYIVDKVLGGDCSTMLHIAKYTVTSQPFCLSVQRRPRKKG